ncbi:MAG TPA: PqiC family protein [Rhodanobacteraceae bacterium]
MRRLVACLSAACICLALAACSSAPVRFYTLMPQTLAPASGHYQPLRHTQVRYIAVLPVTIPAQVDRPQMVVREGDSGVALLDGERWIAPVGDEIRRALSAELTQALGVPDVYGLAPPAGQSVYRIKVNVTRFESVPGQYTLLVATWSVDAGSGAQSRAQCSSSIREPVGQGYAALAAGQQRGVQALAQAIAATLATMGHSAPPSCTVSTG